MCVMEMNVSDGEEGKDESEEELKRVGFCWLSLPLSPRSSSHSRGCTVRRSGFELHKTHTESHSRAEIVEKATGCCCCCCCCISVLHCVAEIQGEIRISRSS